MKLLKNFFLLFSILSFFLSLSYIIFFFQYDKFIKIQSLINKDSIFGRIYGYGFKSLEIIENELDFNRVYFKLTHKEPQSYNLDLSASDYANIMSQIEFFKEKGFIKDELNYWRKAKLNLNDKKYNVKYKLHGTSVTPLRNNFFNLRIKFDKKEVYPKNEKEFNLIRIYSSSDESISTIVINNIAHKIGLLSPKGEAVILKINNVPHGLFYKQERHSKEWFEKNKITNYTLLKNNDDWDKKFWGHVSDLDLNEKNIEVSGSSPNKDFALGSIKILFNAILQNDLSTIKKLIDEEYFAKFLALLTLVNDSSLIKGDNLKFIYDHTVGNFKVLFRHESSINFKINTEPGDFNNSLFERDDNEVLSYKLFKILIQDQDFRQMRDKHLNKILELKSDFIKDAKIIYAESYKYIMYSDLQLSKQQYLKEQFFYSLTHNFEKIDEYLNYVKIFVTEEIKLDKIKLYLINDSFAPVRLKSIKLKDINDPNKKIIINYENENEYKLSSIIKNNQKNIHREKEISVYTNYSIDKFEFENLITKKIIDHENIYRNKISFYNLTNIDKLVNNLKIQKINYNLKEKDLLIKKGVYEIYEDIIFPIGINTRIEKGTIFYLSKDVSILFQGNLYAEGTEAEKIFITSLKENEPFGTFAVVGKKSVVKTNLNNFIIEGGSEATVEGIDLLGQLSIHNSIVSIKNSKISKSVSDDGANIRNSIVDIHDNVFGENSFDQLDLDFCKGYLTNNKFFSNSINVNILNGGDGIDLSGSSIIISKNNINNFKDKGISVGEKSKAIIEGNTFNQNNTAIAVKDESKIYTFNNEYLRNNLVISMYIKKHIFKEPTLYIENKNYISNSSKIIEGKIIYIEEKNKDKFYNNFKNEITASRI